MASRWPISRLNSALLPTLGRPTIATVAGRTRRLGMSACAISAPSNGSSVMGSWSFRAPSANLAVLAFAAVALLCAAPTGAIFVTTLPSGADVWLDGAYVGRSPVVVDALAVGAHHLTLTRTGWTPEDLAVAIAPAQTQTTPVVLVADGKLAEPAGTIALHATDKFAGVTIDGDPVTPAAD